MNGQKPEALRLADELYEAAEDYYLFDKDTGYGAAAELRRLHEVNAELVDGLKLALCKMEDDWFSMDGEYGPVMEKFGDLEGAIAAQKSSTKEIRMVCALIAKSTGEQQ